MKFLSDTLFSFIDGFSAAMARRYVQEQLQWSTSDSAARLEVVAAILDGSRGDGRLLSARLDYDLASSHLGLLVWSSSPELDADAGELQGATIDVVRRLRATQRLVIPVAVGRVWAWFTTTLAYEEVVDRLADLPLPPAAHLTIGSPSAGVEGFARSHREAIAAYELLQTTGSEERALPYRDVDLLSLLLSDRAMAISFARRELGALAAPTAQARDLRATLIAYLDVESSTHAAGERLHIARNTVTYRLHRAEELLERKVSHRRHQLHAALQIWDAVGDRAGGDRAGSDRPDSAGR